MEDKIDIIEVSLNGQEIDQVIASLHELKMHQESVQFPIAADVDLLVNYDENANDPSDNDDNEDDDEEDEDD